MTGPMREEAPALLRELWHEAKSDHLPNGAAALAFYLVLALFPAAIFGLSLLPYLPVPHLYDAILGVVHDLLPGAVADMLTSSVQSILAQRSGGLLSFGFVFALWSASSGLHAVMQQLNVVHGIDEGRSFLRARGVALLLTVLFFVLVVGALALVIFGGVLESTIAAHVGWSTALRATFALLRWVIVVFALLVAFSLVYYLGPNVEQPFVFVTPGSVFATIALLLVSFGFKLYVSNLAHYDKIYGSLGAAIALLVWLFLAGWVILLGAELNDVVERHKGVPREEKEEPSS